MARAHPTTSVSSGWRKRESVGHKERLGGPVLPPTAPSPHNVHPQSPPCRRDEGGVAGGRVKWGEVVAPALPRKRLRVDIQLRARQMDRGGAMLARHQDGREGGRGGRTSKMVSSSLSSGSRPLSSPRRSTRRHHSNEISSGWQRCGRVPSNLEACLAAQRLTKPVSPHENRLERARRAGQSSGPPTPHATA